MSVLAIDMTLQDIQRNMADFAPYRRAELFTEFLIKGYAAFALDSIPDARFLEVLRAKLCLGTLITLYDDFADRPLRANPQLLDSLYQLSFQRYSMVHALNPEDQLVLEFARSLFAHIEEALRPLPNYPQLIGLLSFDLEQFYSANRYSSLLTAHPHMNNQLEKRLYAHHNMGMIIVAMMDLMAIDELNITELGPIREVFLMGQRMGRIFNVIATQQREFMDGDLTGELSLCRDDLDIQRGKRKLRQELHILRRKILSFEKRITSFSVPAYVEGLLRVQALHEQMEGII